jgi:hypothetical protein
MESSDDRDDEVTDNETGYNGLTVPVRMEDIDHRLGPAVILGEVQQDSHVIRADCKGVLVIETAVPKNGETRRA